MKRWVIHTLQNEVVDPFKIQYNDYKHTHAQLPYTMQLTVGVAPHGGGSVRLTVGAAPLWYRVCADKLPSM